MSWTDDELDPQDYPAALVTVDTGRRDNFVPALASPKPFWMDAARPPETETPPDTDGSFATLAGDALTAASDLREITSAVDRARADSIRIVGYSLALLVLAVGCFLVIVAPWGWGIVGLGTAALVSQAVTHVASLRHSAPGVARHKVDTLATMHRDRLESRERLAREQAQMWSALVDRQLTHEERMERMKQYARK